jgi:hypothetical protein
MLGLDESFEIEHQSCLRASCKMLLGSMNEIRQNHTRKASKAHIVSSCIVYSLSTRLSLFSLCGCLGFYIILITVMYGQYFGGSPVPTIFIFFPSRWQIVLFRFLIAQSRLSSFPNQAHGISEQKSLSCATVLKSALENTQLVALPISFSTKAF